MKKIFVSIAAAGVLVAGALTASTIVNGPALAQTTEAPAAEAPADVRPDFPRPGTSSMKFSGIWLPTGHSTRKMQMPWRPLSRPDTKRFVLRWKRGVRRTQGASSADSGEDSPWEGSSRME